MKAEIILNWPRAVALLSGLLLFILALIMWGMVEDGHKMALSAFCVYASFSAVTFALYFLLRKQVVIYGQGQSLSLVMYKDLPSKEKFGQAVHQMQNAKIKYLRETYLANKLVNAQTLNWLRSMGAVKQEEVERFLNRPPNFDLS